MLWLFVGSVMAGDFAITNANLIPITSAPIENASIVVENGKISSLGKNIEIPEGMEVYDAQGKYLMPGIIDVHSHMGVYSWPSARAHGDGNEASEPVTAFVKAEDSIRIADPAIPKARAGGVTSVMILPGSANLIGGEAAILKLRPSRTLQGMQFVGAPRGIKMACGENPKRVHRKEERGPSTRMGNLAHMREVFRQAKDYRLARQSKNPPPTDLNFETLNEVLDGKIRVHIHCYRHDDIESMYRLMDDLNIQIASFQHALEAYKVRDIIIEHGTAIATWPDWWGFKMEAYDATPYNASMVKKDGGVVAIHSDSAKTIQRMYTEAAKMVRYGSTKEEALEMITIDPAKMLGVADRVGSLEVGKDADLALFTKHPLDVYTLVAATWIDGELVYQKGGSNE